MSGLDRRDRGVSRVHRDKQGQDFFHSNFPERNLWFAVIYRALEEIRPVGKITKNIKKDLQRKRDPFMWFFVSPTSSLKWICNNFGIDIVAVRAEADRRYSNLPRKTEAEIKLEKEDPYHDDEMYPEEMQTL